MASQRLLLRMHFHIMNACYQINCTDKNPYSNHRNTSSILSITVRLDVLITSGTSRLVSSTLGLPRLLEPRLQFSIQDDKTSPLASLSVIPLPMKRNLFTDPYSMSKSSVLKLSRISDVNSLN